MFTPEIHFDKNHFLPLPKARKFSSIVKEAMKLQSAVYAATEYFWTGNDHYVIDDGYGKAALKLNINEEVISFWNYKTGTAVGDIGKEEWDKNPAASGRKIEECVGHVSNDEVLCLECGKWVKKWKHYSYAGSVCLKCFNPKKHQRPDTSGS